MGGAKFENESDIRLQLEPDDPARTGIPVPVSRNRNRIIKIRFGLKEPEWAFSHSGSGLKELELLHSNSGTNRIEPEYAGITLLK